MAFINHFENGPIDIPDTDEMVRERAEEAGSAPASIDDGIANADAPPIPVLPPPRVNRIENRQLRGIEEVLRNFVDEHPGLRINAELRHERPLNEQANREEPEAARNENHQPATDLLRQWEERIVARRRDRQADVPAPVPHEPVAPQPRQQVEVDPAVAAQHRRAYEAILKDMEPKPQQPADEVEAARAAWLEWRGERWAATTRTALDEAERNQGYYTTRKQELGDELQRLRNDLRAKRRQLEEAAALLASQDNEALVRAELERLMEHPAMVGFQVEGQDLFAVLRVFGRYNDRVYDLGDWRLRLDQEITDRTPRVRQLRTGNVDGYYHPNYDNYGHRLSFNRGKFEQIRQGLRNGDYMQAVEGVIDALVDMHEDYGNDWLSRARIVTDEVPLAIPQIQWRPNRW